ncbi:MAG: right-handed parallel beta-helix repeat-containing protein [Planctomycetota bacterium]|jgi:hypothetical protein
MQANEKTTKVVASVLALAGLVVFSLMGYAGNLEPTAPPGPTMKTLDEVEPRLPIQSLAGTVDAMYLVNKAGSYYLAGDVTVPAGKHGIAVEANDVTIDLMGYGLIGPGSGTGSGINMDGRRNVEVRNGTVRSFAHRGIHETLAGRNHRIVNVRVFANGTSGILLGGEGHLVKDCIVANNGSIGINGGDYTMVTGNVSYKNGGHGISAYGGTVTGNTIYSNDDSGIYAGYQCLVVGNSVIYNNQAGSSLQAGIRAAYHCFVRDNSVSYNNHNNIYASGWDNCIEQNLVTNSPGDGIDLGGTGNFYANNRASGNGTDFANVGGNTDGGGNWPF